MLKISYFTTSIFTVILQTRKHDYWRWSNSTNEIETKIEKVFLDIFVISKKTVKEHPAFPLVENNQQQLILTHWQL